MHSSLSPSVNRLSAPRPVSYLLTPSTYCVPISKFRLFWTDVIRCITLYIYIQPASTPSLPMFNQRYDTGSTSLTKWKKSSRARAPRVRTPPNSFRSRLAKAELGQSPPPIHSLVQRFPTCATKSDQCSVSRFVCVPVFHITSHCSIPQLPPHA